MATPGLESGLSAMGQVCQRVLAHRPLIVASNRGPVEHQMTADSRPDPRRGSGGVVTALNTLAQTAEFTWVSSAMGEGDRVVATNGHGARLKSPLLGHKINLRYVVTPRRVYHKYYNVLCNPLLWFLQHYMWNPPYNPNVDAAVHEAWHGGYIPVNQAFARAVAEEAQGNPNPPIVMGHDYHLYLLPQYVRQEIPKAIIHHFIHIPWPTPRFWQLIPTYMVKQICASLCSADVLGFQSPQDRRSFLDTVEEFLPDAAVDHRTGVVIAQERQVQIKVYPISINVAEVKRIAASPRATDYETRLRPLGREVTVVRIDRAEPNKNVVRGFKAYELLLARHPELHGKITFLAFLVPSRTHIRQYQRYTEEIQQAIDQVNRAYGNEQWQPIHAFMENNYTQAVAGMKLYDVLLVNTLIEGTNLVAKEGPVVNTRNGVVILSETSGVHHQLSAGALSVSPTDVEGTMEALYRAVNMSAEERRQRAEVLAAAVSREDIHHWVRDQFEDLAKLL
ncbi:MAG TPA: trehalose-6-phosphate synthase [Dehalococcoidia bacterium]|nr:trehalose-6-phosphate synthase [Dehalococcoidia bacterium]